MYHIRRKKLPVPGIPDYLFSLFDNDSAFSKRPAHAERQMKVLFPAHSVRHYMPDFTAWQNRQVAFRDKGLSSVFPSEQTARKKHCHCQTGRKNNQECPVPEASSDGYGTPGNQLR